ncbi:hypothetical protein [Streptomyces sp. NPDC001903]|uniref:hypothetical protein n=1 Tax=Streptomyces sp. NPDC001903 TaxID=3364622 RepID=UPI00369918F9
MDVVAAMPLPAGRVGGAPVVFERARREFRADIEALLHAIRPGLNPASALQVPRQPRGTATDTVEPVAAEAAGDSLGARAGTVSPWRAAMPVSSGVEPVPRLTAKALAAGTRWTPGPLRQTSLMDSAARRWARCGSSGPAVCSMAAGSAS